MTGEPDLRVRSAMTEPPPILTDFVDTWRPRIDDALDRILPPEQEAPRTLHRAMRYSALAEGKRLRPLLVLAAAESCSAAGAPLLPAAGAVELIHAYSLIHDDLPAFDDDEVRRGRPTSHVVFGEAMAILAGDALQTLAFTELARAGAEAEDPARWIRAAAELGEAAGSHGMAGGQCLDLQALGRELDRRQLAELHAAKTGALLAACLRAGAILAGADDGRVEALGEYGRDVGLAFQIVDDILDVEGSLESLGKVPGSDASRGQPTYSALMGVEEARREAARLRDAAIGRLDGLADPDLLVSFAHLIVDRRQ